MTIAAFLEMIGITLIPFFLLSLTSPETASMLATTGLTDTSRLIIFGSVILVLFFVLKNVYILIYNYAESRYIWNRYTYIGSELLTAYTEAPFWFHREAHSTTLQKNIAEEARYLIENLLTPFLRMMRNVLVIVVIGALLIVVEPIITLASVALIGGSGAFILAFLKKQMTARGVDAHHARLSILRRSGDLFTGMREFRVLNRTGGYKMAITDQIRNFSRSQTLFTAAQNANKPLIETLAVTGVACISVAMWLQGRTLTEIAPVLALFGMATVRLLPEVRLLIGNINAVRYFQRTMIPIYDDLKALDRLSHHNERKRNSHKTHSLNHTHNHAHNHNLNHNHNKAINHALSASASAATWNTKVPDTSTSKNITASAERQAGGLTLKAENLTFTYPDGEQPVINKLNLHLPAGSVTGLAGASGSGKSTLIDLLLGLLSPQSGEIHMNNLTVKDWLSRNPGGVGYIPQMIFLSDDTLRRNIALGMPDEEIDDDRILQCLEAAQLKTFAESLPEGLDTTAGEQGVRLSGGQRQRLGIARALYHQPALIIMDEATSALDDRTEFEVLDAIEQLRGTCTMLMISHRTSGLRICDQVWRLENGSVRYVQETASASKTGSRMVPNTTSKTVSSKASIRYQKGG